jgi:uncharacterized membrane protein
VSTETKTTLYEHIKHLHTPRNVNAVQKTEQASGNFNQSVAIGMTRFFQSMPTFWLILAWIVLWMLANLTLIHFDPMPFPLLLALASIPQLPLMVVIMIGQGVLGRHAELQADEAFQTTQRSYHDIEQIILHLDAQDSKILEILEHLNTQQTRPVRAVKKKTEAQS